MFSFFPDVAPLIEFLKTIQDGTIVLMATYDDGATKYVIGFKQHILLELLCAVLYWKNTLSHNHFEKDFVLPRWQIWNYTFSLLVL